MIREREAERERKRERQTDRQTGRQTDRQTDRQRDSTSGLHASFKNVFAATCIATQLLSY